MSAIVRSSSNRALAGVIGGIAEHLGWSPVRTRVGYILLSVLSAGFPGILVYLVLWFLMPEAPRRNRTFNVT